MVFCLAASVLQVADGKMMAHDVFYSEVCAMLGDRKQTIIYKSGGKRRAIVFIRISSTRVRNTKVGSSCNVQLFDSLIMKFLQLLTLCYHYLVSNQDFKKCCDEVPIFKVECICVNKMVVLEIFAPNAMNATVLWSIIDCLRYSSFTFQNIFFFLEVRLGCGSSTKIKTADIQRIMCATVVTLEKA